MISFALIAFTLLPLLLTQTIIIALVLFFSAVARKTLLNEAFEFPLVSIITRAICTVGIGLLLAALCAAATTSELRSSPVFIATYLVALLLGGDYPMESFLKDNDNPSKHTSQFARIVLLLVVFFCGIGLVYFTRFF